MDLAIKGGSPADASLGIKIVLKRIRKPTHTGYNLVDIAISTKAPFRDFGFRNMFQRLQENLDTYKCPYKFKPAVDCMCCITKGRKNKEINACLRAFAFVLVPSRPYQIMDS